MFQLYRIVSMAPKPAYLTKPLWHWKRPWAAHNSWLTLIIVLVKYSFDTAVVIGQDIG